MDELGKSFPASEGFVDAQEGTSKEPVNEFCLNCGTKLLDKFCHHCGQKDIPKRQSMGELFVNFLSSFLAPRRRSGRVGPRARWAPRRI
jgi:hypothetical protein